MRAALTPGPSPALRERGDLGCGRGIVDRRRYRIATATLTSPLSSTLVGEEAAWGKVRAHHPPFLSLGGSGRGKGEGEGASSPPSSPAAWERKGG